MTDADDLLARDLAERAGELLLGLRDELRTSGATEREIKDAGDARSHEMLAAALAEARPDDAFLSEEGRDDLSRVEAHRVWIVDPLDGTREYGEGRRTGRSTSPWPSTGRPAIGAVALPGLGLVLVHRRAAGRARPATARPPSGWS